MPTEAMHYFSVKGPKADERAAPSTSDQDTRGGTTLRHSLSPRIIASPDLTPATSGFPENRGANLHRSLQRGRILIPKSLAT